MVCMVGDALLTLSASVGFLKPPLCTNNQSPCPPTYSSLQMMFFYVALYLTAIGNGFTSTAQAFGADQYDKTNKLETLQKSSFFNWYYFANSTGSLVAGLMVVYIQARFGFSWGFGMIGAFAGVGLFVFLLFSPRYRHLRPAGNPFLLIPQVLFAAISKIHHKLPSSEKDLYNGDGGKILACSITPRSKAFRFLDKAAINRNFVKGVVRNRWQLCTLAEVDEVKSVFGIAPIWFCSVIYGLLWTHMVSMFVEQGAMMNLQVGSIQISPSSLNSLDPLNVIFWTLIYEQLLRPWLAHRRNNAQGLTVLQRMIVGLTMVMLAMICAAVVETRRLSMIRAMGLSDIEVAAPMSVLWQIPQFALVGASEMFYCVGHHEFFYNEISDTMRTLGSALPLLAISVGSILSGLLVTFVSTITASGGSHGWIPRNLNQGHLDWYFWLLSAISAGNLGYFLVCSRFYASEQTMVLSVCSSGDEFSDREPLNPAFLVV
ncbi:hypothetical protein O6H91_23G009000 [Diphasiastrum complanatum]|nr:hypothetical protein O6H91_23G009000 [Diphasiastrum complanatum]